MGKIKTGKRNRRRSVGIRMASDKQRKAASAGRLLISQQLIKNLHEEDMTEGKIQIAKRYTTKNANVSI